MSKDEIIDEVEEVSNSCDTIDLPPVNDWLQTGCTMLDFAVANRYPGGLPVGRITQIFGGNSTCKSLLAYTLMGYAVRAGMSVYYADVENSINHEFIEMCGCDITSENIHVGFPATLEDFFDSFVKEAVKDSNEKGKLVICDSITALSTEIELEKGMSDQGYGYRSKAIHKGLRTWNRKMAESGVTLVAIDQTRDAIGSPFAGETTVGGKGLEFFSSVRIYLKHRAIVKNSKKMAVGTFVDCNVKKTRFGPPFRGGLFKLDYKYGLDDIYTNLGILAVHQSGQDSSVMKKTSKVEFNGEIKTIKAWIPFIEENDLEDELRKAVWEAWKDLYDSEERKPRKW